jgi:hypothetical protein
MPQQRALARPWRAQHHYGGLRHLRQHLPEVMQRLAAALPAWPGRVFPLIQQQGKLHEALVQGVALASPARLTVLVIVSVRLGTLTRRIRRWRLRRV